MPGRERDRDGYALGELLSAGVARNIREMMGRRRLKPVDLHNATHIPLSHLSDLLSTKASAKRRRNFQRWHIVAIARALETTEAALLPETLPRQLATANAAAQSAEPKFGSLFEAIETWSNNGGDPLTEDSEFVQGLHRLYERYKRKPTGSGS